MTGYCMRCRAEREIANAKTVLMKNGRPATEGQCPVCGTRIFRLGGLQPRAKAGGRSVGAG